MKLNISLCKFLISQNEEQIEKIIDFLMHIKKYNIKLSTVFNKSIPDICTKYKDIIQLILLNNLKYEFYDNPISTIREYLKFLRVYPEKVEFFKQLIDRLYNLNIEYLYYFDKEFNSLDCEIKLPLEEKIFTDGIKVYDNLSNDCKIKVFDYNWIVRYEKEISFVPGFKINSDMSWKSKYICIRNLDFDINSLPTYEEVLNTCSLKNAISLDKSKPNEDKDESEKVLVNRIQLYN